MTALVLLVIATGVVGTLIRWHLDTVAADRAEMNRIWEAKGYDEIVALLADRLPDEPLTDADAEARRLRDWWHS